MLYFNCSLPSTRLEPAYDTAVVGFLALSREIIFLVLFILGYFSNNCTCISRHLVKTKELNRDGLDTGEHTTLSMATVIEDEVATGHYETAVRRWRAAKEHMPTPAATLRLVLKGLLRSNSKNVVDEITEHMSLHSCHLNNHTVAAAMLEAAGNEGDLAMMEDMLLSFEQRLGMWRVPQLYEAMISTYALADATQKLFQVMEQMHSNGQTLTLRGHSLALKGLLKNGNLDAALIQMKNIISQGYMLPHFAIAGIWRVACEVNRLEDILDRTKELGLTLSSESIHDLIQHCSLHEDAAMVQWIKSLASPDTVQPLRD